MAIISSCSFPQAIFSPSHSPTRFHTDPQLLYISNTPTPPLSSLFLSKTSHFLSKPRLQHLPFFAPRSQFFSTLNPYLFAHQPHFPTESLINIPLSSTSTQALHDDFINLLHLSVRSGDTRLAKEVHASILKFEEDTHLGNVLIVAYLKLGLLVYAQRVFVGLSCPSVVSYATMISGFAKSNREYEAMELFSRMRSSGIQPNEFSFVAILTACIRVLELGLGSQFHALVFKMGYVGCVFVTNALMGLYARCGSLDLVVEPFAEMPKRDTVRGIL